MPFIPHTPESFIPRSDSKNPTSTCRGITASGRPCRRSIAPVVTIRPDPLADPNRFCWQHKDQVVTAETVKPLTTLQERSSIDTLVDRLGIVDLSAGKDPSRRSKRERRTAPPTEASRSARRHRETTPKQRPNKLRLICCAVLEDEHPPPARPRHGAVSEVRTTASIPPQTRSHAAQSQVDSSGRLKPKPQDHNPVTQPLRSSGSRPDRLRPLPAARSKTAEFLSLIPSTASTSIASQLLAELVKPPSATDDDGYIYVFWLTPASQSAPPPRDAARDLLLAPPSPGHPRQPAGRRTSDVLRAFAETASSADAPQSGHSARDAAAASPQTILLKIGRASNVQRRLNEWTRQCGYDLSLIRYYPYYKPTSPAASPRPSPARAASAAPAGPTKVPRSHKVERLIHLELAPRRAQPADSDGDNRCGRCGREHREWFAVEASRAGIAGVDAVIRRWVEWSVKEFGAGT